jgi:predicted DNA-binding transcriptional regulator YafY
MRADRLLSIVLLLQSRGRLTAPELAGQLEVSVRTIYRDMVALGAAGIPVYADQDGYRLVDGYRTQLNGLTPDDARSLVLAELPGAAAELGLAHAAAAVRLKVSAALPDAVREQVGRARQRFHLDAPGWYHDGDHSDHLAAVADAVWHQHAVDVTYETWHRVVHRRLQPYGLVLKAGRWYLVARADDDIRTFRVNQIQELTVLPQTFPWPEGFELATYWREHIAQFRARLYEDQALVRLAPAAIEKVDHLMGRAVAAAVARGEIQPDGWTLARIPIESQAHAQRELLRFGVDVEVLEPASLRDRMTATATGLAALYRS